MRIRRQPQPQSSTQGARAENSSNGSLSSPAVEESKTASVPQDDMDNMHASIGDLSMIYSASKFRASVNWLDRLRAAKGFPADPYLGVEEVLSSRACSPEETQRCCLEEDESSCPKQENIGGVDVAGLACHNTDLKQCKVSEASSCRTSASDIKNESLHPCSNGVAELQSLHRQTGGEQTFPALQLRDNNDVAQGEACKRQSVGGIPSVTGNNRDGHNDLCTDILSRSTIIQSSLCEDRNIETALSQLYFNMFADLFCMESRSRNSPPQTDAKRRHRKQDKPKVCSTFADPDPPCTVPGASLQLQSCEFDKHPTCAVKSENPTSQSEVAAAVVKADVPSSSPEVEGLEATLSHPKKALNKVSTIYKINKKGDYTELDGVPKNDLFIIDTSLPGWRTEKIIYRKGNGGWRIRSKGAAIPAKGNLSEPAVNDAKKQVKVPPSSSSKTEPIKAQRQWELDTCTEKNHKVEINPVQCTISTDHVARVWNIAPHTHMRSSRKRRKTTLAADFGRPFNVVHKESTRGLSSTCFV